MIPYIFLSDRTPLSLFEALALGTWDLLGQAHVFKSQFTFTEETITQLLAFQILRSNVPNIRIHRVNQQKESEVGFDWEWWVGSQNNGWICYSVQAKRLNTHKNRYENLRHEVKGKFQIDILEKYSLLNGTIPLYCFYNWITDNQTASKCWHCHLPDLDITQLGCTIAPLHVVRTVHEKGVWRTFEKVHEKRAALPWRCLFHKPLPFTGGSLPDPPPKWFPEGRNPRIHPRLPLHLYDLDTQTTTITLPLDLDRNGMNIAPQWIVVVDNGIG